MSTRQVAAFVAGTNYRSIPSDAVAAAKKSILDLLGVAVAASRDQTGRMIVEFVKEAGGRPEAGVIAGGFKTSPYFAALANGTLGHALDYDDDNESWLGHPTAPILPAVLALAQKHRASGKDVLNAYIVGWEVAARVGATMSPRSQEIGWHNTGVIGVAGAAAAAARILELDARQTTMALGIGASQASGLRLNFGTNTKPLHAGLAASNGVRAAQLAQKGFTANESILENPLGYCKVVSGRDYDSKAMEGLGSSFDIGVSASLKAYPTNYCSQRSLDSILHIVREHNIGYEDVAQIECRVHPLLIGVMPYSEPKTALEAKFSLPYCMAAAVLYGEVGIGEFTDEKVTDVKAQELVGKVKVTPIEGRTWSDYTYHEPPELVSVVLKDGTTYSYDAHINRGHSLNPMTWNEVVEKFTSCVKGVLPSRDIDCVVTLTGNMESLDDVAELMDVLSQT
ncbi:MmgE/PrpD family protein [Chloroflexota bacterium]